MRLQLALQRASGAGLGGGTSVVAHLRCQLRTGEERPAGDVLVPEEVVGPDLLPQVAGLDLLVVHGVVEVERDGAPVPAAVLGPQSQRLQVALAVCFHELVGLSDQRQRPQPGAVVLRPAPAALLNGARGDVVLDLVADVHVRMRVRLVLQ